MAQIAKRLTENVEGDFYVDASCIDCDACRQIAPASFRDHGGQSSVYRQPQNPGEQHRAFMALVACPTASIGTESHRSARQGVEAFPVHVVDDVLFLRVHFGSKLWRMVVLDREAARTGRKCAG